MIEPKKTNKVQYSYYKLFIIITGIKSFGNGLTNQNYKLNKITNQVILSLCTSYILSK